MLPSDIQAVIKAISRGNDKFTILDVASVVEKFEIEDNQIGTAVRNLVVDGKLDVIIESSGKIVFRETSPAVSQSNIGNSTCLPDH